MKSISYIAGIFLVAASSAQPALAEALHVSCFYSSDPTSGVEFVQTSSIRMVFAYTVKGDKLRPVADTFETRVLDDADSYKFNLNFNGNYLAVDFPKSSLEAQGQLFKGVPVAVKMDCIRNRLEPRLF